MPRGRDPQAGQVARARHRGFARRLAQLEGMLISDIDNTLLGDDEAGKAGRSA